MRVDKEKIAPVGLMAIPFLVTLVGANLTFFLDTQKALAYSAAVAIVLAFIAVGSTGKGERLVLPPTAIGYAIFFGLSLVSLAWSRQVYDAVYYVGTHLANLLFLVLIANAFRGGPAPSAVFGGLGAALALMALVGFAEKLGIVVPFGYAPPRIVSTMGNAGYLGFALAPLLPAMLAAAAVSLRPRAVSRKKPGHSATAATPASVAYLLLAAACAYTLFLSGSRAGMISTLAGSALLAILWLFFVVERGSGGKGEQGHGRRLRALVLAALVLLALVALAAAIALSPRVFAILRGGGSLSAQHVGSFFERINAWKAAVSIWLSKGASSILFGRGLGSYYVLGFGYFPPDYVLASTATSFKHAHSEYLELLADGGLASLLSWLALAAWALLGSLAVLRDRKVARDRKAIAAACMASLTALLLQSLIDPGIRSASVQVFYYFFIGLAEANRAASSRSASASKGAALAERRRFLVDSSSIEKPAAKAAVLALCALFAAASVWIAIGRFRVDSRLLAGYAGKDNEAKAAGFEAALALEENNVYALFESLRLSMDRQGRAIALADRIEGIIPGYRETRLLKGVAQATAGDFAGAAESLESFLAQNALSSPAYTRLVACRVMLGEVPAIVGTLERFFEWQHKLIMSNRDSYFDLEVREFRILPGGETARLSSEGGGKVAELGGGYLEKIAQLLAQRRSEGFVPAYITANLMIGSLYDELGYADVGLSYYAEALSAGRLDARSEEVLRAKFKAYYDKASSALGEARGKGDAEAEARAKGFLGTYIGYLLKFGPDESLERELQSLR